MHLEYAVLRNKHCISRTSRNERVSPRVWKPPASPKQTKMATEDTERKQNHTLGAVVKHPWHALQKTLTHTQTYALTHTESVCAITLSDAHTDTRARTQTLSVSEALKDFTADCWMRSHIYTFMYIQTLEQRAYRVNNQICCLPLHKTEPLKKNWTPASSMQPSAAQIAFKSSALTLFLSRRLPFSPMMPFCHGLPGDNGMLVLWCRTLQASPW